MSPLPLLRKPEWEQRDASRRATAVASLNHPDLLARLPDIARSDVDAKVRGAAVRRLDDLALLGDRMRNDADGEVRTAARQRYLQRLLDTTVAHTERERVLQIEDDAEVLIALAERAPEAALRRLALERLARPGLDAERCVKDPDPALRQWLLERISEVAVLERIAERVRKSDKLLTRLARERAQSLKLASGDPVAINARALAICEELDSLRRNVASDAASRQLALAQEWNGLRGKVDEAMDRRVAGYFAALDNALAAPPPAARMDSDVIETTAEPVMEAVRESDTALKVLLDELQARASRLDARALADLEKRWQARVRTIAPLLADEQALEHAFRAVTDKLHHSFAERARQRDDIRVALPDKITALEAAVAAGHVAQAQSLQRELDSDRSHLGEPFATALARRFGVAVNELERLTRWQHWSGNKARTRLIAEVEALAGSGLHPDALAERLKELQTHWRQLDEAELRAAEAQDHPLTARFHAAARRVMAPTRAYFEKRHAIRGERSEEIDGFIQQAHATLEQTRTVRDLLGLRRQVIDHLRLSDELEPSKRRDSGRRLRDLLNQLKLAIGTLESEAEMAKRKLLANLRRDLMHAELDAALPIARQAQTDWKALPRASRSNEDALWEELRGLVDPWFKQADAQQRERHATQQEQQQQAQAIVAELEQLASADAITLAQADARLAQIATRWRALSEQARASAVKPEPRSNERGRAPRKAVSPGLDERAYDRALERVQVARARQQQHAAQRELQQLLAARDLCDRRDAVAADAPEAAQLADALEALNLAADARAAIASRAQASHSTAPDIDAQAQKLLVKAELAAGLDSPEHARALRRQLQIERLSAHLSGSSADANEIRSLLLHSLALPPATTETRDDLRARWQRVIETHTH
ncbi:MAG TPA: DUF349 domain-containing protein [Chiayiivirga sp.]|nr:DUF349 domain-containing protein [Chiayiivirga sp.]